MPFIIGIIPFAAIVVAIVAIAVAMSKKQKSAQNNGPKQNVVRHDDGTTLTETQRKYLHDLQQRKERQTRQNTQPDRHVRDAQAHEHIGEEEHYDEIIGSLGDVDDEGCADLDGVRFVAHDLAYAPSSDRLDVDYDRIARAIVLGEVLDTPRYKYPYLPHGKR